MMLKSSLALQGVRERGKNLLRKWGNAVKLKGCLFFFFFPSLFIPFSFPFPFPFTPSPYE
jgi:hypothetical protein